jgi:hypothetical protein
VEDVEVVEELLGLEVEVVHGADGLLQKARPKEEAGKLMRELEQELFLRRFWEELKR